MDRLKKTHTEQIRATFSSRVRRSTEVSSCMYWAQIEPILLKISDRGYALSVCWYARVCALAARILERETHSACIVWMIVAVFVRNRREKWKRARACATKCKHTCIHFYSRSRSILFKRARILCDSLRLTTRAHSSSFREIKITCKFSIRFFVSNKMSKLCA